MPAPLTKRDWNFTYDPQPRSGTFAISDDCEMPVIIVTATRPNDSPLANPRLALTPARFVNTPSPAAPGFPLITYDWTVTLRFDGRDCPNAAGSVTEHPSIKYKSSSNRFRIPFSQVRGGKLTISVAISGLTTGTSTMSDELVIVGTNPTRPKLAMDGAVPKVKRFRKLLEYESSLWQFLPGRLDCPYFSSDLKRGVGLSQITPWTDPDQVWSWKANVNAGWGVWNDKMAAVDNWVKGVRTSRNETTIWKNGKVETATFDDLVERYNEAVQKKNDAAKTTQIPATAQAGSVKQIELEDFNDDQRELECVRSYNGYYPSTIPASERLREHQVKVDANGLLMLNARGNAQWEQVSSDDRSDYYDKVGFADPYDSYNYVETVEKKTGF
jgi:hypothetical protein